MFSVIVSIYKVEKYIRQCIESVLNQTYSDFELILIDDGSPDACPKICDEYAQKDTRIKVIHKENGGLMSTRQVGVSVAKRKYVCFVDGDDFIQEDMLETYYSVLQEHNVDVICCGYSAYTDGRVEPVAQKIPQGFYNKETLVDDVYPQMLSTTSFFSFYIMPSVCTKCFRKEIIQKVYEEVPNDISLGEDVAASYPTLLRSNSVRVIDYFGYMYRQNQSSMTHTYDKALYRKTRSLVVYLQRLADKYQYDLKKQVNEYVVFLLCLAKNNELIYNTEAPYFIRKQNLALYLKDEVFAYSIKMVQLNGFRNRFILWCFRNRIMYPLYLLSRKNEGKYKEERRDK